MVPTPRLCSWSCGVRCGAVPTFWGPYPPERHALCFERRDPEVELSVRTRDHHQLGVEFQRRDWAAVLDVPRHIITSVGAPHYDVAFVCLHVGAPPVDKVAARREARRCDVLTEVVLPRSAVGIKDDDPSCLPHHDVLAVRADLQLIHVTTLGDGDAVERARFVFSRVIELDCAAHPNCKDHALWTEGADRRTAGLNDTGAIRGAQVPQPNRVVLRCRKELVRHRAHTECSHSLLVAHKVPQVLVVMQ
mmetsp:Transcript_21279/g.55529  ORF Transcript_21279/g.55529 Transcript_21279/m.55529 type:complete len:248 (-) Transcript_21279:588-1331(-)